jgi:phosphoglycerate dehydrogenase-like enzyme
MDATPGSPNVPECSNVFHLKPAWPRSEKDEGKGFPSAAETSICLSMSDSITIWCNAALSEDATHVLTENLEPNQLLFSTQFSSNLTAGEPDPLLAEAAVAFGQPDPQQVIESPHVKWVHLTSAGYTRYDTDAFRAAMLARDGKLTNSSMVYSDPCAEHAAAMVMALARQLPQALDDQRGKRRWTTGSLRADSRLLRDQTMLIYGFGSIARRLVELLKPFGVKMTGVRRSPTGDEGIPIVTARQADALLPHTDHVMNILPASTETDKFFDAHRLGLLSPDAIFYNIGRGTTVDQAALVNSLRDGRISGAYLDVTHPEPLPADHPLWQLSNCWITPHTAGGHHDEAVRLAQHFRANLQRYLAGNPLLDRVI